MDGSKKNNKLHENINISIGLTMSPKKNKN